MSGPEPLVRLRGVVKDYRGLRPLRVKELWLHKGESLALLGFDAATAELLVNLITGAILPDAGEVYAMGQLTSAIPDADAWVATLDRFGLISERTVLLDPLTVEQNLAMAYSLELDAIPADVRQLVERVRHEVGIAADELSRPLASVPPAVRLRVRLGRALALDPLVLLSEHPNAVLPPHEVSSFAADLARIVEARGLASLVLTADPRFARAVARGVLTLQPATGELKKNGGWRRWF